jgi:endonuclease/exonuclease/phosphatase family metal-dependent hydrolase
LAIVHINFFGYDEQAHRRGPSSRFAHWTLKGIDDAISRIWRAAHRSARRHYDVWIYSDHGQERVQDYERMHGRSFAQAVAEVFAAHEGEPVGYRSSGRRGVQFQRVRLFGGKWFQRLFAPDDHGHEQPESPRLAVAPLGPVAMVYYDKELAAAERTRLARAIVERAKAPAVLVKEGAGRARAWTGAGEFALPEDSAEILGEDHPFLDQAAEDLIALCHHPDAGDFVVCGWCAGVEALTFAVENGAHGGAGPEETGVFTLLPRDITLSASAGRCARPADLRDAARKFLRRCELEPVKATRWDPAGRETVRIMTYNVHSCIGMDGKLSPERVARVIARYAPDVVALQELDVGRLRSEGMDQAHLIARYLGMEFHFHPAMHVEEERYGDAILTHLPMRLVKAGALPGMLGRSWLEPRGALWVSIDVGGTQIQVINTHLGLLPGERQLQAQALLGADWLAHSGCREMAVLCGDFNALPSSPVCRRLRGRLKDAQLELRSRRPRGTFFGRLPTARIDHVLVDSGFDVVDVEVPNTELTRIASDHLPLIVELRILPTARRESAEPIAGGPRLPPPLLRDPGS